MSLIADKDLFIHSLRLSYLRHVLPSHAPHSSSIPGTGSYNLISFEPSTSPYIIASGYDDETKWPELKSGRSSPPLSTALSRSNDQSSGSRAGTRDRRNQTNASGLRYRETIYGKSSGSTGPGMRVGGRSGKGYSGKGRRERSNEETGPEDVGLTGTEADKVIHSPKSDGSLKRSESLEASLHRRRLSENTLHNLAGQQLPPVVIHSPKASKSERESSANVGQISPAHPSELESSALAQAADASPELERAPDIDISTIARVSRVARFADEPAMSLDSPTDGPSDGGDDSEISLSRPQHTTSRVSIGSSLLSDESLPETSPSSMGPRFASVASSGVSLFGVSRLGSNDGLLSGRRERSDSDSSFPTQPAAPTTSAPTSPEPPVLSSSPPPPRKESTAITQAASAGQLPASTNPPMQFAIPAKFMRAPRERRRVNISGRPLVAISEPLQEEDNHQVAVAPDAAVQLPLVPQPSVTRPPEPVVTPQPVVSNTGDQNFPNLDRRPSGPPPNLKIDTAMASKPPSSHSSPLAAVAPDSTPNSSLSRSRRPHVPRSATSAISFSKRPVALSSRVDPSSSAAPVRSNLAALLNARSDSGAGSNPFSTLYAALISRASDALKLSLYFPGSEKGSEPVKIGVKRDLTVEEVIGCGLWAYWEEGRKPQIEVSEEEADETTNWNLRIVEEDGEVDEDFPALDRTRAIAKFSFGEFAIVRATVKDNQLKQATITRRPSRVLSDPKRALVMPAGNTLAAPVLLNQDVPMSPLGSAPLSTTGAAGGASSLAVGVLLRIRLPAAPGVGLQSINTAISVPSDMYINDVLEHVCKKRGLEPARDWAFIVRYRSSDVVVPLDRTIESLGDQHELSLIRRSETTGMKGAAQMKSSQLQNTNPSASIFKRQSSDPNQPKTASDLAATYRRYNVMRKLPVPLGRHPRIIAIDGDYIHFLPSDSKGDVFSAGRTTSFHISMLKECGSSRRSPVAFKILVQKDRVEKRYDFEAENPKQAHEIVAVIRSLMASYKAEEQARQIVL